MAWTVTAHNDVAVGRDARPAPEARERLSPAALDRALELRDQIGQLVRGRPDFLARSGRDASLYPPAGSPADDALGMAYLTVMQGDQRVLSHLRLLRQIGTGAPLDT